MKASNLRRLLNLYLPLRGAGIRVDDIAEDFSYAKVSLRLRWYNRNYVGTHFGGSLFAMTDPFWMIMVMHRLGPDYIVWDKSASIEFVAPGRGRVTAEFMLDQTRIDALRDAVQATGRHLEWFESTVQAEDGSVVARVRKQVYVRRKAKRSESASA